jgi:glyoxylase-like metal-dependent hydrolase (beta-lactamase superfamily II)
MSSGMASVTVNAAAAVEPGQPAIYPVFEKATCTWQFIVADPSTGAAVIIDPVLDFDAVNRKVTTASADELLAIVKDNGYTVERILETHAHADHLTAAAYLQRRLAQIQGLAPSIGIGKRIGKVQRLFGTRYGIPSDEWDVVFDKLFEDDEVFALGNMEATVLHLPGHTPDHIGYRIGGEAIFFITLLLRKPADITHRQRLLWRFHLPRRHRHRSLRLPWRQC